MAGNLANFHGKQAAEFGSSPHGKKNRRKKNARKTAKGLKKNLYTALATTKGV